MERCAREWSRLAGSLIVAAVMLSASAPAVRAQLPDGRVYEQVTPTDKNAADVIPNVTRTRASLTGDRVTYAALTGFGDANGIGISTEYLASRDSDTGAWDTHGISAPQDPTGYFGTVGGLEPIFLTMAPDLTEGVLSTRSPLTDAPNVANAVNLYRRDDLLTPGAGSYELLTDAPSLQPPSLYVGVDLSFGFWKPKVAGVSADFSTVLLESRRNLTTDAPVCVEQNPDVNCPPLLYKYGEGTLRLVGILPPSEGGGPAPGAQAGRGALEPNENLATRTLSDDGSRAIFTVPTAPAASDGTLYMRADQGTPAPGDDTTVRISGTQPATYWTASADGSLVFFTTSEQLTADDTNASDDVYRFDADGPGSGLTRISVDAEPADGVESRVDGVIGASDDGSYLYFVTSENQLVSGGPTGPTGGSGGKRIFVWHDGVIHEVGAVNLIDAATALGLDVPRTTTSRITPDGTHLAFVSEGTDEALSLYGRPEYDHGEECPGNSTPDCSEVYVYDATANGGTGDLRCASCYPTGAAATGDAYFTGSGAGLGASSDTPYQNHPLTDDGRYVFFNTAQRLHPDDQNDAVDAYEYDTTTGLVHLISAGRGTDEALFMDASPDGHDVFFATRERLRSTDVDQSRDLYDARIGGVPDPGVPPKFVCSGDDCRGSATGATGLLAPPSEGSLGPDDELGNAGADPFLAVKALTKTQRRKVARGGKAHIALNASQPGTVRFKVLARIGKEMRTIVRVKRKVTPGAAVLVPLQLTKAAEAQLGRKGLLHLKLVADYSQSSDLQVMRITLHH